VQQRPESESAARFLATAQAAAGDVVGARLTLATAAERWAELGLALSAETAALRAHLAILPVVTPSPPARRVLHLPFVGREEAFAQLRQAYHLAQAGGPGGALVYGPAGVGKSRLVDAFVGWVRVQGADVAVGHADELSGRLPYQPLMELLRERLARERAPDDLVEDSWLVELQRLVPDLHDRYPDLPLPVDDAAAGARLLEAIAQLGLALARRHPLMWVVDDLQWADEATRDALLSLLKRWGDAQVPALVVCTLRSEEIATSPALENWLAVARRTTAVVEVMLAPLSAEGSTEVVTTLLAGTARAAVCAWLYAETQGNPLYLAHVLQALVERGVVQWQDDDQPRLAPDMEVAALEGWLPETLRGMLLQSVRRLEPAAQQTLVAAAVVGTRFDEELLVSVAGVEEEAVLSALELAERRLLIRAEGGQYRFAHDKVAEAVYGDLSLARRRVFHRRALRALETAGTGTGAASAAELARHAVAAEDWEAALRYSQQAALAAQQIGARRDAVRYYEQVLHLLTSSPSQEALQFRVSDEMRAALCSALGLLYAHLGEHERAAALHADLLAEARRRGARVLEGQVLVVQGQYAWVFQRDYATAQRLLEEARQIAQEQGNVAGLLTAANELVLVALQQGDLARSGVYAQQTVTLARESRDRLRLAQGLNRFADVCLLRGEWEAGCAASEESLVLFASLADEDTSVDQTTTTSEELPPAPFTPALSWATFFPQIAPLTRARPTRRNNYARQWGADGLMGMGLGRLHLGEGETGRAALQLGWQIFGERHEQRQMHRYLLFRTFGWIEAGAYEQALHEVARDREAFTDGLPAATDVRPLCAVVEAHHALFQLAAAREALDQAEAFAPNQPIWERLLPATRWCTQHALVGDWAAAVAAAREAQALREAMPSPLTRLDLARSYETEALLRAGDRVRAEADVRRLGKHVGANRRYRLLYLRMQALLDRAAGAHTTAITHLREALDLATQLGLPGEEWQLAAELAASHTAVDDEEHAAEARGRAEQVVATLAARITDPTLSEHFAQGALSRRPALG
jgi:tetratricopeptide (TPR) repeat protein